ncbi:hypothetical protein BDR26DRAFT_1011710 [Obelidium mucronatum]|nr:hypothetical protein BDR26DRAFT_1011710 [Obelidium mucronatum]
MPSLFVSNGKHAVAIDTEFGRGPNKDLPLEFVAHVVAACAVDPIQGLLGLPSSTPLSLHLPPGVALTALGLASGEKLQSHVRVASLLAAGIGIAPLDGSAPTPLIIKAETLSTLATEARGGVGRHREYRDGWGLPQTEKISIIIWRLHKYCETILQLQKILCKLKETVVPASSNAVLHTAFVFLEGSSGTGKTQAAITLLKVIGERVPAFFCLFKPLGVGCQPIYSHFESITALFNACVKKDEKCYDGVSPSCGGLIQQRLYIFGFVAKLLQHFTKGNIVEVGVVDGNCQILPLKGMDVLALVKSKSANGYWPTFAIDECNILLGTDSEAVQLIENSAPSSREGAATTWCHVFNSLPKLHVSLPDTWPFPLRQIILNSRPWFAHLAINYWKNAANPTLDKLIVEVHLQVSRQKRIFETPFGKLGQIRLFLNSSYCSSITSALIHGHFACLDGVQNFTLDNTLRILGTENAWTPRAKFPPIKNDCLLFLTLLGSAGAPAFVVNANPVPYLYFWQQLMLSALMRKHMVTVSNAIQPGNDGNDLEALLAACVCVASHSQGTNGTPMLTFIQEVIFHLQSVSNPARRVNLSCVLKLFKNSIVPFLSSPGQWWPDYMHQFGTFGNLKQCQNQERLDLSTDCGITGECKDYSGNIQQKQMVKILNRVPSTSKLHIVLVRSLQQQYFVKRAMFHEKVTKRVYSNFAVYRLCTTDLTPSVSPIKGIPLPDKPTGVVGDDAAVAPCWEIGKYEKLVKNMRLLFVSIGDKVATIDTDFGRGPNKDLPLEFVAHVVAACAVDPIQGLLGLPSSTPLSLHLPPGVALPPLSDDNMDDRVNADGSLCSSLLLSELGLVGRDDRKPLIIKAETHDKSIAQFISNPLCFVTKGLMKFTASGTPRHPTSCPSTEDTSATEAQAKLIGMPDNCLIIDGIVVSFIEYKTPNDLPVCHDDDDTNNLFDLLAMYEEDCSYKND